MWTMIIYRDDAKACRWSLVASNGRKFACSGESFARPSGALKAAKRMIEMLGKGAAVKLVDQTAAPTPPKKLPTAKVAVTKTPASRSTTRALPTAK